VRLIAVATLVAGCGRLDFDKRVGAADASSCAVGHDEDADGVADICDGCPHVADSFQTDGDGDGVGDACDPEPGNPRQTLVVFDGFETADPARWASHDPESVDSDDLVIDATVQSSKVGMPYTPSHDLFEIRATVGPITSTPALISLMRSELAPAKGLVYCELQNNGTSSLLKYTYTIDRSSFPGVAANDALAPFGSGEVTLRFEVGGSASGCDAIWQGESLTAHGTPPVIATETMAVYVQYVLARVHYYVQIHTDDAL
jgi:hypothetical protein